jgi:SAM-dependent methyltransferase
MNGARTETEIGRGANTATVPDRDGREGAKVLRMPCVVCRQTRHERLRKFVETTSLLKTGTAKFYPLYQCSFCKLVRPHPLPYGTAETDGVYESYDWKPFYDKKTKRITTNTADYRHLFTEFRPYQQAWQERRLRGRFLDVGCGSGQMLVMAENDGFATEGLELDKEYVHALRKDGHTVVYGDLSTLLKGRRQYDVITANHVFEHIVDVEQFIKDTRKLLKTGGYFILAFPYIHGLLPRIQRTGWYGQGYGQHVNFFSKKSIRLLFERQGFAIDRMTTISLHHVPQGAGLIMRSGVLATVAILNAMELGDNLFIVAKAVERV